MCQSADSREIEEPAAAFYRMNKAKNFVESRKIVGVSFPTDQRFADSLQRLARLRYKFAGKVVHAPLLGFHHGNGA